MADEISEAVLDTAAAALVNFSLGAGAYDTLADFQRTHWRRALAAALPPLVAERDAEITRLREQVAAWKAHATHLDSRMFDIWVLTEKRARSCNDLDHDDVCTVAELADSPPLPDVLAETPAPPTEGDQT